VTFLRLIYFAHLRSSVSMLGWMGVYIWRSKIWRTFQQGLRGMKTHRRLGQRDLQRQHEQTCDHSGTWIYCIQRPRSALTEPHGRLRIDG
jgi:hypothetical protein